MDAQTIVMSFTTIVGLICNFRQEHGDQENLNHRKFIEWLDYHRHEELKTIISNNIDMLREIDTLLQTNHLEIQDNLRRINEILVIISSKLNSFSGIAHVIAPRLELSKQAEYILVLFYDSNAQMLVISHTNAGPIPILAPGHGFTVQEPRFLEDDLDSLVACGFLSQDYTDSGNPKYRLTRLGAKYAQMIKKFDESTM